MSIVRRIPGFYDRPGPELPAPFYEGFVRFYLAGNEVHLVASALVVAWVAVFIVQLIKGDVRGVLGVSYWLDSEPKFYCTQPLNMERIFSQIGEQVVRQERALARMQQELSRDGFVRSVALVGPPGVGKTLTTDILRQQFPWQSNIFVFFWRGSVQSPTWRYHVLQQITDQISCCGMNLIVLDMLNVQDYDVADAYTNELRSRFHRQIGRRSKKTVLVVYIFDLDTADWNLERQIQTLQKNISPHTPVVAYRPFGIEDLPICLENELKLESTRTPNSGPYYYALSEEAKMKVLDKALTDIADIGCYKLKGLIREYGEAVQFT
ncbi:uncharacterized protein LOC111065213 [Drosophila obscura]|uniref:uncharacterized protein LOC111065213 n=1 Tax=Drosophila obscura TaxID=7282 RepID=UPI001BB21FC4|nr:uncharacterized protein LOC111065213 [Drosophila obscura]